MRIIEGPMEREEKRRARKGEKRAEEGTQGRENAAEHFSAPKSSKALSSREQKSTRFSIHCHLRPMRWPASLSEHNPPAWGMGMWLTRVKIAGKIEVVAPLLKLVHFRAEIKSLFSLKQPVSLLKQLIPNRLQQAEHLMAEDST